MLTSRALLPIGLLAAFAAGWFSNHFFHDEPSPVVLKKSTSVRILPSPIEPATSPTSPLVEQPAQEVKVSLSGSSYSGSDSEETPQKPGKAFVRDLIAETRPESAKESKPAGLPLEAESLLNALEALPESRIETLLVAQTELTREKFSTASIRELARQLIEIAYVPGSWQASADLGLSINDLGAVELPQTVFSVKDYRLYASFNSPRTDLDTVLVKWGRPGEDPLFFQAVGITPGLPVNHIWFKKDTPWEIGTHVVEIYDPRDLTLALAGSLFFITPGE